MENRNLADKKRVLSIDIMAYVLLRTDLTPELVIDSTGLVSGYYPKVESIELAIKEYHSDSVKVELKKFLSCQKALKTMVYGCKDRAKAEGRI